MTTETTPSEAHTPRPKSRSITAIWKLIDDFFAPWGSWKTAWWELEVGDSESFGPDALLREIHKRLDGPDWEALYLRDMEAIADLVGKPDMSRLYDVLQAAVNERPKLLERLRKMEEALRGAQGLATIARELTGCPADDDYVEQVSRQISFALKAE